MQNEHSTPTQQRMFPVESDSAPRIMRLSELESGQTGDCFVLLSAKTRALTRDGKPYYRVEFRDARRTATAMIWSDSGHFADCESKWQVGEFYKLRCKYVENQYGPHVDLDRVRPVEPGDAADGFDAAEFSRASRFDVDRMFAELMEIARSGISDAPLRQLTVELLEEHAERIKQMPAAARHHHAYRGGFLEHVLSVTRTAVFLADKYSAYYRRMQPPLSKSLVLAGAILHDIGKLQELDLRPQGADYTSKGRLIGHVLLGRDMIRDKAATVPDLDPEILLRLEHVIVSHQNLPEWGSPVTPHTPEALLVYFADDVDAKFHMMAATLEDEPDEGDDFTSRNNALRRNIFRGLH